MKKETYKMTTYPITIDRAELYQQVWAKPMSKLAQDYEISDVALAKLCRKESIPLPGQGYWAKIAAGRTMKPIALPPVPSQSSTKVLNWRSKS